jgi:hypothetical protein
MAQPGETCKPCKAASNRSEVCVPVNLVRPTNSCKVASSGTEVCRLVNLMGCTSSSKVASTYSMVGVQVNLVRPAMVARQPAPDQRSACW